MKRELTCLAAAATLSLASGAAWSAASASASFTNMKFALMDLDLNDGVTPWISFSGGTSLYAYAASEGVGGDYSSGGLGAFDTQSLGASSPAAVASEQVGGNWSSGGGFITSTTNAWGSTSRYALAQGQLIYSGGLFTNFTMSSRTALIITGDVQTTVSTTSPDHQMEQAFAEAYMGLSGSTSLGNQSMSVYESAASCCFDASSSTRGEVDFLLGFTNLSSSTASGKFSYQVDSYAYSSAPVPEPESLVLMLAGLGVVGVAGRRRRLQA